MSNLCSITYHLVSLMGMKSPKMTLISLSGLFSNFDLILRVEEERFGFDPFSSLKRNAAEGFLPSKGIAEEQHHMLCLSFMALPSTF